MGASIKWLCADHGELRVGPDHVDWSSQDPWTFGCVVQRVGGTTALLSLATDVRNAAPYRAEIHALLVAEGFSSVAWERAGKRTVTFPLGEEGRAEASA